MAIIQYALQVVNVEGYSDFSYIRKFLAKGHNIVVLW